MKHINKFINIHTIIWTPTLRRKKRNNMTNTDIIEKNSKELLNFNSFLHGRLRHRDNICYFDNYYMNSTLM